MEKPPILVTSDVKFAVMKDGTIVMDDETREGAGAFDVAKALVDIIEKASEDQILTIAAAKVLVFDPVLLRRMHAMKDAMDKRD